MDPRRFQDELLTVTARCYCIAFSARSGSTALACDLEQVGLGSPFEHFQPPMYTDESGAARAAERALDLL